MTHVSFREEHLVLATPGSEPSCVPAACSELGAPSWARDEVRAWGRSQGGAQPPPPPSQTGVPVRRAGGAEDEKHMENTEQRGHSPPQGHFPGRAALCSGIKQ